MTNEKYNGWTNQDTWEANLILTNDHDIHMRMLSKMREPGSGWPIDAKSSINKFYRDNKLCRELGPDFGRVNWDEIQKSVLA